MGFLEGGFGFGLFLSGELVFLGKFPGFGLGEGFLFSFRFLGGLGFHLGFLFGGETGLFFDFLASDFGFGFFRSFFFGDFLGGEAGGFGFGFLFGFDFGESFSGGGVGFGGRFGGLGFGQLGFEFGHLAVQFFAGFGAGGFFLCVGLADHRAEAGEEQKGGEKKLGKF